MQTEGVASKGAHQSGKSSAEQSQRFVKGEKLDVDLSEDEKLEDSNLSA